MKDEKRKSIYSILDQYEISKDAIARQVIRSLKENCATYGELKEEARRITKSLEFDNKSTIASIITYRVGKLLDDIPLMDTIKPPNVKPESSHLDVKGVLDIGDGNKILSELKEIREIVQEIRSKQDPRKTNYVDSGVVLLDLMNDVRIAAGLEPLNSLGHPSAEVQNG